MQALVQSQGRSGSWPRSGAADPLNNLRSVRSEMALSDSVYEPRQAHPTAALQSVEQVIGVNLLCVMQEHQLPPTLI